MTTRRRIVIPTALLIAVVLTACGGAQSRFATHMKRGQDYLSAGDYSKASVEFRNAMQIQPKDASARLLAGTAAERLGRPREALGLYQAVVESEPDNTDARAHLARIMIYSGAADVAMKTIEPALTKHPEDPVLLTLRGAARVEQKDEAGAVADLDHALKIAPANEEAIQARAGLYKREGDIPAAIKLVSEAVQHTPASRTLREVLVDLYTLANDPPHLEEQLRALIGLAPKETRYRYQLAIFYSRTHRPDDAQRTLEEAVKTFPRDDQAKLVLVEFISTQRKREDGEKALRQFIAKEPGNYVLRLGLGSFLQNSGDDKAAAQEYQEIVARDGTGAQGLIARDRLAMLAWSKGKYDEAHKLVAEVLQKNPHDNEALTLNGEMALARSDPASAIGDLRAVLRDQPQSVGIQRLLARAYVENGQPGLAEETLRAAIETAPADTSLRIELAQVLKQTQRVDQAIALLEKAVHDEPADAAVRESLVRTYLVKRDFAKARTAAQDLKVLRPASPSGFYLAGLAAEGLNQPAEAQKEYTEGLAARPGTLDLLSALARIELRHGQSDQAIALVKDAAEKDPSNAGPVLNLLGELYLTNHDVAHAEDALTRATQAAPKWWPPYRNLALAKLAKNDSAGAIATYQTGIKVAPSESKLVIELALLLEKQNHVDDAIKLYEGWYKQNPRTQIVANNLAMLLVTYKTDPSSLDRARDLTASFASSTDGNLLDTNGWVHFKRAEYTEALPVLERAVAHIPDSRQIRYHLGMAELRVGQTDRARTELEAAVAGEARFVGSDEARAALAALKSRSG
jgi:tetratricopeptide (TPR) repeat protein